MSDRERLMLLRVQLYTAMQALTGDELREFWTLINEITALAPPTTGRRRKMGEPISDEEELRAWIRSYRYPVGIEERLLGLCDELDRLRAENAKLLAVLTNEIGEDRLAELYALRALSAGASPPSAGESGDHLGQPPTL